MMQSSSGDIWAPGPEDLAAYVDGQLDLARRKGVETWLRQHPEAAVEIEGQRQLERLWRSTTPAEPEGGSWATILACVTSAYFGFRSLRARRHRLIQIGATALAASLLLVLLLPRGPGPGEVPSSAEPLAVVSPDDVEIVSLRAADRVSLVVGVPPVTEPLVLASRGDVELEGVEPDADGMVPSIHMDDRSLTPMIVAPLDAAPAGAPEGGTLR